MSTHRPLSKRATFAVAATKRGVATLRGRGQHFSTQREGTRRSAILSVIGVALGLVACAPRPAPSAGAESTGNVAKQQQRGVSIVSLRGHIKLDPRAGYQHSEGELWQHLFYLDDVLFDGLLCYAHADRCELVSFSRRNTPQAWSATLTESLPHTTPFVTYFDVLPGGDWRTASRVDLRVIAPSLGEVGATTLRPDRTAGPPAGLREKLRAEQTLRRVYESIAHAYRLSAPTDRQFPASRPERPSPPPCGATWVRDEEVVAWLGLSVPLVLDWAFGLEADAEKGMLRLIARRDRSCHGDIVSIVLNARIDEYGDFERLGIVSSAAAPQAPPEPLNR